MRHHHGMGLWPIRRQVIVCAVFLIHIAYTHTIAMSIGVSSRLRLAYAKPPPLNAKLYESDMRWFSSFAVCVFFLPIRSRFHFLPYSTL